MIPAVVALTPATPSQQEVGRRRGPAEPSRQSNRASELLRKQQRDDQEDGESDREDQTDEILGSHSFSTPRTMTASSANTPIVSSTNQKSVMSSPSADRCVHRTAHTPPRSAAK